MSDGALTFQIDTAREALAKRMKEAAAKNIIPAAASSIQPTRQVSPALAVQKMIYGTTQQMMATEEDKVSNGPRQWNEPSSLAHGSGRIADLHGTATTNMDPDKEVAMHAGGSTVVTTTFAIAGGAISELFPSFSDMDDLRHQLERLPRVELQKQAKRNGIKANLGSDKIITLMLEKAPKYDEARKEREGRLAAKAAEVASKHLTQTRGDDSDSDEQNRLSPPPSSRRSPTPDQSNLKAQGEPPIHPEQAYAWKQHMAGADDSAAGSANSEPQAAPRMLASIAAIVQTVKDTVQQPSSHQIKFHEETLTRYAFPHAWHIACGASDSALIIIIMKFSPR
jgi:hypothetical protein